MLFYIIFEGICNSFAEIMKYADRDFYGIPSTRSNLYSPQDDWWNSVNFEEFARKWNKPGMTSSV
jgi:sterol O-acyltransferase